ncbi:MAG: PD-(D/E)XK nuclease family protein [Halobacteriales archaeon]
MPIDSDAPIDSVGEHEVDYCIVQLLETSDSFRRWLLARANANLEIDEYIGAVAHATYAGQGESDIEFGVVTKTGQRHAVLIENKIDATKQPNQIERYYDRGQYRVENGNWDSFTVCVLAPERYVSQDDEAGFDSIIHYEDVLEQIEELAHDGSEFFQDVFELALRKSRSSTTADASKSLDAIRDRFLEKTELSSMEEVAKYAEYNKRVSFKSTHPQHPEPIRYDVFVGKIGEEGRTTVRLQIESIEGLTEEEREDLKSMASRHTEALPDFDWNFHRKVNIANKTIGHEEAIRNYPYDNYIDAIVDELLRLTNTFHPIFVSESMS